MLLLLFASRALKTALRPGGDPYVYGGWGFLIFLLSTMPLSCSLLIFSMLCSSCSTVCSAKFSIEAILDYHHIAIYDRGSCTYAAISGTRQIPMQLDCRFCATKLFPQELLKRGYIVLLANFDTGGRSGPLLTVFLWQLRPGSGEHRTN
jgi:hypothetical protein